MLEPAVAPPSGDRAPLAGVAEGRVPEVVRQRDRLGQVLVQPERRASVREICATSIVWVSRVR